MLDLIVLHGEFSIFTVRGNFWYQIYRNRRKKVLCSRLSLITLTIKAHDVEEFKKLSIDEQTSGSEIKLEVELTMLSKTITNLTVQTQSEIL